jgi:hypothetical protein
MVSSYAAAEGGRKPKEFTKRQLYAMLAEAVRNTG